MAESAKGDVPPDGSKWPDFCKAAIQKLGYKNFAHVQNALRDELSELGQEPPYFYPSGENAQQIAYSAAHLWKALVDHQKAKVAQ